ncbi:tRNA:m(4)X modification enzyme TRM13 homolog [Musca vetustissima]|uniref:tRNA:m(4)X modification enzyme TRM13 homolog n=1 Tax=Musca vetustissima TaxID=27455 RepID=UPI002AB78D05|nr:tRNA:m(4)X modification enzyme TRM13 homolog [Musca vetustissima]
MSESEQPTKKQKMTTDSEAQTGEAPKDIPQTTTGEKTCKHWVQRKKRFCKMTVAKGKEYCGEHAPAVKLEAGQSPEDQDRIPCPLDGKHTVYKKNLNKHLKICNAKPKEDLPEYIQKNVNAGEAEDALTPDELNAIKLSELEDSEFYKIIDKVKDLYGKYVEGQIKSLDYHHKCMDEELAKEEYGKESRKHLLQAAALLGILDKEQTIQNSTSFVEFGAGKGQLAFYLSKLLENMENSQVVLVDRMSLRHKKDNKIEDRSLVQRIRADIIDFKLEKLPALETSKHCMAVSKHLCGGATDLSLRCIVQAAAEKCLTDLIMIAVCCHHRCDWSSFVGKEFFKRHEVTPREFAIITKMVSWAICGTGMSRERRKALEEQNLSEVEIKEIQSNQRLSLAERETIGFMCKRILDYARLEYLRQNAYDADLYYYVEKDVTLENVVLLARRKEESADK